jgi:hypothetical protein
VLERASPASVSSSSSRARTAWGGRGVLLWHRRAEATFAEREHVLAAERIAPQEHVCRESVRLAAPVRAEHAVEGRRRVDARLGTVSQSASTRSVPWGRRLLPWRPHRFRLMASLEPVDCTQSA